ncbi:unnamed protein product, partial [Rotaria sordida]
SMSSYLLVLIVADFEYLPRNNTGFRGNITTNSITVFDLGAMGNFGCIMYIKSRLLYNNITSTMLNKQDVALFIAHELSHRWFGKNKVYPDWDSYEQHTAQE